MPIQFEEVTATVTPPAAQSGGTQSAAPKPVEEDFGTRLEQALRQMAERAARLADD